MNEERTIPDHRLYFLAFDHRAAFARAILDVDDELTPTQEQAVADGKAIIFEGIVAAARDGAQPVGASAGVLVDERYGADVARRAAQAGLVVAMPVEAPDLDIFDFAYGEAFGEHIEAFSPSFAKVLVRYNVEGDTAGNALQAARLKRLSDWLVERGRGLLFELIVEPTPDQLQRAGGDRERFERKQRPALICAGMAALQDAGVEVDVWKLEGVDALDDARAIVAQARAGDGRDGVRCIVLGAGADAERVTHWLRVAAAVDGYAGFAIGRSIWRAPLRDHLAGTLSREAAAQRIAESYARFADVYESARGSQTASRSGPAEKPR